MTDISTPSEECEIDRPLILGLCATWIKASMVVLVDSTNCLVMLTVKDDLATPSNGNFVRRGSKV
jgi:hypothetical protein